MAVSMQTFVLTLHHVGYKSQGRVLLSAVTTRAAAGELIALLGPSGAGKSTLLRILSGEYRRYSGAIGFNGRPLGAWKPRDLERVRAAMPPHCPVTFGVTAAQVVAVGLPGGRMADVRHTVIRDIMGLLEIRYLARRPYSSLSGGEQKRVQLARVLAQIWQTADRRLLLLDDCIAGLDRAWQERILLILRRLVTRAGLTIIAVCDDPTLAAAYADRIVAMADGGLVAQGAPGDVLTLGCLANVWGLDACLEHREQPSLRIRGCLADGPPIPSSLRLMTDSVRPAHPPDRKGVTPAIAVHQLSA